MKAMILTAGKGTRVRPLTRFVPKPMIPMLGRPVMEFVIDHLRAQGFDQVVVNTSCRPPQIQDYFRDGSRFGVEMAYSFEGGVDADGAQPGNALGPAGGMRRIQDFPGFFDDTFVALSGDAVVDVNLRRAVAAHRAAGAIATLVVKQVTLAEVSGYTIVGTDDEGVVRSLQEKPKPSEARSTLGNTGIYVFEPQIFDFIPAGQVHDIGGQLPALIAAGARVLAAKLPFEWVDIAQTSDYWAATMRLLRGDIGGARIPGREVGRGIFAAVNASLPGDLSGLTGPIWIGGSAAIAEGATIVGPAAIGPGAIIEAGARIERSVVWDDTRVTGYVDIVDRIVCGPYCISSTGECLSLPEHDLSSAFDDARRTSLASDAAAVGGFGTGWATSHP